jgi:hypothetical protein
LILRQFPGWSTPCLLDRLSPISLPHNSTQRCCTNTIAQSPPPADSTVTLKSLSDRYHRNKTKWEYPRLFIHGGDLDTQDLIRGWEGTIPGTFQRGIGKEGRCALLFSCKEAILPDDMLEGCIHILIFINSLISLVLSVTPPRIFVALCYFAPSLSSCIALRHSQHLFQRIPAANGHRYATHISVWCSLLFHPALSLSSLVFIVV